MSSSEVEQRAQEDALVAKANEIRALWKSLATAFNFPQEEPPRNKCHWDFVLQEQTWLATDMMQERLWKEAVAYQLAHEAMGFKRSSLRHVQTVETGRYPGLGKVRADGKPDFPDRVVKPEALANGNKAVEAGSSGMEDDSEVESVSIGPLLFTCTPEFIQSVAQHLQEEEARRLARHADAQDAYQLAWDTARRIQPPHFTIDEDDLPLGKRKRKFKPGSLVMPGADDDYELGTSPLAGKPPRPGAAGVRPLPGRVDDRKRKQARGEYGDEEFDPKSMQRSGSMRPGGMGGMRTDSRSDLMMGGGMDKKGVGAQKGAAVKTPPGKGSLQRIDPMGKGSQGMARGGPWGRSQGLGQGPWSQQDDQLLIAIVAEFNQNWHLVADVLRSASSMSGVTRKFDMCKHRYMQLAKEHFMQQNPDKNINEQRPEALLAQTMMSKQDAKDVIGSHVPVAENVLELHQRMVAELAGRLRQKRLAERQSTRDTHRYHQPSHPSHQRIQQGVLQQTGNRVLSPLDVGVVPMDPPFHAYRHAQQQAAAAAIAAAQQNKQQQQQHGTAQAGAGAAGAAAGQNEAAAAAAAAQAQAVAAAAAAAAVSQQGAAGSQGGVGAAGGSTGAAGVGMAAAKPGAPMQQKMPPGLTKEQLLERASKTPIPQLQEQFLKAQAALQANPTSQELKIAYSHAQAVLSAAKTIYKAKAERAAQAAAAAAAGGQQGVAAAGGPGAGPGAGAAGGRPSGGMNLTQQLQQAVASGRLPRQMAQQIVDAAKTGSLTPQHMAILQQLKQQSQAAAGVGQGQMQGPGAMPGVRPNIAPQGAPGMNPAQMAMPPPGQPGMWNNAANMQAAAAAAAAAQQAAQQAAEQARLSKPK